MNNKKRFITIILIIAMVLAIFPASMVFAKSTSYTIDFSKVKNPLIKYDKKTKSVTVVNKAPFGFDLKKPLKNGDTITVTLKGTYKGSKGFRVWLIDVKDQATRSNIIETKDLPSKPGKFTKTFKLTATGVANQIFFKGPTWQDQNVDNLTISSIKVTK